MPDVCALCSRPVHYNRERGGWQHTEIADEIFCGIFAGTTSVTITEGSDDE